MKQPIPTNLILGFLGVGKTTAILDLLKHKPDHETWAVLVNEFGAVGIDGALLAGQGAVVREVPGGCMCCVAGLPMQIGLNRLIHDARPDRLLIEPTGLGHPTQIIDILTSEHYADVVRLNAVIGLVDPRRLDDPRVMGNEQFQDQVATADVLVANKSDLCSGAERERFMVWAEALEPTKGIVAVTEQGRLQPGWLEGPHSAVRVDVPESHAHAGAHHHADADADADAPVAGEVAETGWSLVRHAGQGHVSIGWLVGRDYVFDGAALQAFARDPRFRRFKAVVRARDGWCAINAVDGVVSSQVVMPQACSRLEAISEQPLPSAELDDELRCLVAKA